LLQVPAGFFEVEVDHHQRKVETRVIEAKRAVFPSAPAAALDLGPDEIGFVLKRLRHLDGQVALYSINYLLPDIETVVRNSEVMTVGGSLNRALHRAGWVVWGARRSIEAVSATTDLSELLEVPLHHPLVLVTSVSWNKDQRVFDYYTSWLRSDVLKVTVEAKAAITKS
jgi:GntR family transcriptional regulator